MQSVARRGIALLAVAIAVAGMVSGCSMFESDPVGTADDVASYDATGPPEKLPGKRSFEAVVVDLDEAEALVAEQPSLEEELTSRLAGHFAAEKNGFSTDGPHLIVVIQVCGGRTTSDGAEIYAYTARWWWSVRPNGEPRSGNGVSTPVRVRFAGSPGEWSLAGWDEPGDGTSFAPGVNYLIPSRYRDCIWDAIRGNRVVDRSDELAEAWAEQHRP